MLRKYFVLINHPVGRQLPYVVRVMTSRQEIQALYNRQEEGHPFLSKRELEHLCVFPMCGPRYSFLEIEIDTDKKELF